MEGASDPGKKELRWGRKLKVVLLCGLCVCVSTMFRGKAEKAE